MRKKIAINSRCSRSHSTINNRVINFFFFLLLSVSLILSSLIHFQVFCFSLFLFSFLWSFCIYFAVLSAKCSVIELSASLCEKMCLLIDMWDWQVDDGVWTHPHHLSNEAKMTPFVDVKNEQKYDRNVLVKRFHNTNNVECFALTWKWRKREKTAI